MKRILAVAGLALALVAPVQAAPDVDPTVDPFNSFLVTRILPNQRETTLAVFELEEGWTTSTVIREVALAAARQNRTNNPSWRIVIYGPIDPPLTWYTNGDRVWDSAVDL
jgi:hypothetical protein